MGSRAYDSAAATRAAARMYQPGTNTGGITHARPGNTHQPDGSRLGTHRSRWARAADGAARVSRQWLPPVHIRPRTSRSAFPGTPRFGDGRPRRVRQALLHLTPGGACGQHADTRGATVSQHDRKRPRSQKGKDHRMTVGRPSSWSTAPNADGLAVNGAVCAGARRSVRPLAP